MIEKKFKFTDNRLLNFVNETTNRIFLYDTKQPGLAIRITPLGKKTFKFSAWDSKRGRSVELTLGTYPKMGLNEARNKARELASSLSSGIDIMGQSQAEREIPKLDEAFNRWIVKKAAQNKTSWVIDQQRYNKHIKPRFGNKLVNDITQRQIEDWFLKIPKNTGLSTTSANRLLVIIKTVYNKELRQYANPCAGILLNREESRERFLGPSEIPGFLEALNSEMTQDYLRDFVYLLLFTGARKSNLLKMKWNDIDRELGVWVVNAAESKNRRSMTLPLIPEVQEILNRRWVTNQSSQKPSIYVFPSISPQGRTGHMADVRNSWDNLLKRAGMSNFRIHDIRRTLGSWQTITGASNSIVGKSLGHRSSQSTQVYARMDLDPVRKSIEKAIEAILAVKIAPLKIVNIQGNDTTR